MVEFDTDHRDFHLPDIGLVAAFRFRGEVGLDGDLRAPAAALTGLHDRVRSHEHQAGSAVAIAAFTPLGASAFFHSPLNEMANRTVELFGSYRSIPERLAEAGDHQARFDILERVLLETLGQPVLDLVVASAVARLESEPTAVRIPDLAREVGLSQSALERRFNQTVGATPKRFAELVRLQRVLRLQASGTRPSGIAQEAGYYDQSHFSRDFRRFVGLTPENYFGQPLPR